MQNIVPTVQEIQVQQSGESEVVLSLEELIKSTISSLENLTVERKKLKQQVDDGVNNDAIYQDQARKAKLAKQEAEITRLKILQQTQMRQVAQKVKDISSEIREKKASLSDYLLEYQRITQATQLELFDGQLVEIVKTAKVVRRSSK